MSFVIAARNAAPFVAQAVESALAQTYPAVQVVVVDDGSTDATPQILARLAAREPRLLVLARAHGGMAAALNAGVEASQGELIARLDADDVALPDRLRMQVDALYGHPRAAAVGGAGIFVDAAGREFARVVYPTEPAEIAARLPRAVPLLHSAVTVRRQALEEVGGYRAAFGGAADYDLWLRLSERYELLNLTQPVVAYRWHPGQMSLQDARSVARCVLAGRAAARRRREGGKDPFDGASTVTDETLRELAVGSREVAEECVRWLMWLARSAGRAGYHASAEQLWRQALNEARGAGLAPLAEQVEGALGRCRRQAFVAELGVALASGAGDARRRALAIALGRGFPTESRLKAVAAALAPGLAGWYLRRLRREGASSQLE